jgi:hypothetical protein
LVYPAMAWTRRYDEPEHQRVNRWLAQSQSAMGEVSQA